MKNCWAEHFEDSELVAQSRHQFVTLLKASGFSSTDQACVFGSHYLLMTLNRFSSALTDIVVCGGGLSETSGIRTEHGSLEKHMWVSALYKGVPWYLDITADQFGYPGIIHAPVAELETVFVADPQAQTESLLQIIRQDPIFQEMANR